MALHYRNTWLALGLCAASLYMASEALASQARIGVVGAVNPSLMAIDANQHSRPLALGNNIFPHELITSNAKGNAQLIFIDKSTLSVSQDASFKIEKFAYDPASSNGEMVIYSTKGTYRFIGGALSKKHPVIIRTPVSTVSIKGGIAIVEVDGNTGETNATFAYGDEMTVSNASGDTQTVSEPGYSVGVASDGSPPSDPVKVESGALQDTMDNFASDEGQNGGATTEINNEQVATTMNTEGGNTSGTPESGVTSPGNTSTSSSGGNSNTTTTDNTTTSGVPTPPEVVNSNDTKGAKETRVVTKTKESQPPKTGEVTGGDTPPAPASAPAPAASFVTPPPAASITSSAPPMDYMNKSGLIVTGTQDDLIMSADAGGPQCSNCLFADWGIWAADVSDPNAIDLSQVTYYMKGEPTQNLGSISLPAQVNYHGLAVGNTSNALTSVKSFESGTFTAAIDMGHRTFTDFNMTYANRVLGFTNQNHVIPATGIASFSGLAINELDSADALTGTINGALFGSAAQNIGGNFDFNTTQGGGALHGAGVYVGKR